MNRIQTSNDLKLVSQQQGVVLFLVLMFLLVTTLLAVTSLGNNVTTEKMVRASTQRQIIFEAAESALLEGEQFVNDNDAAIITGLLAESDGESCEETIDAGAGGLCVPIQYTSAYAGASLKPLDHWREGSLSVWASANRHRLSSNKHDLASAPKYIIEFMGYSVKLDNTGAGDSNCKLILTEKELIVIQNTYPFCTLDNKLFRITVLATSGNNDQTRVMLQSTVITLGARGPSRRSWSELELN